MSEKNCCSWGRMKSTSSGYVKQEHIQYWLNFLMNIWIDATHEADPEHSSIVTLEKAIKQFQSDGHNWEELPSMFEGIKAGFEQVQEYLVGLNHNPVDISSKWKKNEHHWIGTWFGAWTSGRYLIVDLELWPLKLTVEWDTATGTESSFMGLPSSAIKFADENSQIYAGETRGYVVKPLKNQYVEVLNELDIENEVGESRSEIFRAESILESFIKEKLDREEVRIRLNGYEPY